MILLRQFLTKTINPKLVIGCLLSFGLLLTTSAQAAYRPGRQKPAPTTRRSDAGTTRGCVGEELPLTVLASRNYLGRSTSTHPTLAWFVPPDSGEKPMKFALYEWVTNGKPKVIHQQSLHSSVGIMKLSPFAQNEPGLQPGKTYLWQVVIQCDPDNPSGDLVSETSIEVITVPVALQRKLNQAAKPAEKVNLYAEEGLWYDALGEALKFANTSKLGELGSTLISNLAQSETALMTSELSPQLRSAIAKQITTLKQIATSSR